MELVAYKECYRVKRVRRIGRAAWENQTGTTPASIPRYTFENPQIVFEEKSQVVTRSK